MTDKQAAQSATDSSELSGTIGDNGGGTAAPAPAVLVGNADDLDSRDRAIRGALGELDPAVDDHWTDAGLPRLAVVRRISGIDDASRDEIVALEPDYSRDTYRAALSAAAKAEAEAQASAMPADDALAVAQREADEAASRVAVAQGRLHDAEVEYLDACRLRDAAVAKVDRLKPQMTEHEKRMAPSMAALRAKKDRLSRIRSLPIEVRPAVVLSPLDRRLASLNRRSRRGADPRSSADPRWASGPAGGI